MTAPSSPMSSSDDPVSNVLKWILLAVAILTFGLLAWATVQTYERVPPQPDAIVSANGNALMTADEIFDGKAGFQKADLMDYGSLYGMGSYFGEDYTADILVRLGTLTQDNIAKARFGKPFASLTSDEQASAGATMREDLQRVDLTKPTVTVPAGMGDAIVKLQNDISI